MQSKYITNYKVYLTSLIISKTTGTAFELTKQSFETTETQSSDTFEIQHTSPFAWQSYLDACQETFTPMLRCIFLDSTFAQPWFNELFICSP